MWLTLVNPHVLHFIKSPEVDMAASNGVLDGLNVVDATSVLILHEQHETM